MIVVYYLRIFKLPPKDFKKYIIKVFLAYFLIHL